MRPKTWDNDFLGRDLNRPCLLNKNKEFKKNSRNA